MPLAMKKEDFVDNRKPTEREGKAREGKGGKNQSNEGKLKL